MRKSVDSALRFGCQGNQSAGFGPAERAEIARSEWYLQGQLPLHTLRADIDYGFSQALHDLRRDRDLSAGLQGRHHSGATAEDGRARAAAAYARPARPARPRRAWRAPNAAARGAGPRSQPDRGAGRALRAGAAGALDGADPAAADAATAARLKQELKGRGTGYTGEDGNRIGIRPISAGREKGI